MFGMLIAYDADGNIIATRDYQVVLDPDTLEPLGFADYLTAEKMGMDNSPTFWTIETWDDVTDVAGNITQVPRAQQPVKGSKVWPEWIGARAHEYRVELDGPAGRKRIKALVHKTSGHKRERATIEAEVASRVERARERDEPADLRDLLGGPDRPLQLDVEGKTRPRAARSQRPALPVVRRAPASPSVDDERTLSQDRGIPKNAQDV